MGRPSNRTQRRAELVAAFAHVLADHGYANATMVAVAAKARVSPGLLHYHFRDKGDMLNALVDHLTASFLARSRRASDGGQGDLDAWIDGALNTKDGDPIAARCWVGVLGEALRDPALFARIQRLLGAETRSLHHRSGQTLSHADAAGLLSLTVGYLVVGAFRPDLTGGQAAAQARRFAQLSSGE